MIQKINGSYPHILTHLVNLNLQVKIKFLVVGLVVLQIKILHFQVKVMILRKISPKLKNKVLKPKVMEPILLPKMGAVGLA